MKPARLYERVAAQIASKIAAGEFELGARLPSERELAQAFDVSRPTVREAIFALELDGLVEVRMGSGVYVAENADYRAFQITRSELNELADVIKLLEMRLGVETEMAGLAAARRTTADIGEIQQALHHMVAVADDPVAAAQADRDFHLAIARATQNEYYVRFVDFLGVRLVPSRNVYLGDRPAEAHQEYAAKVLAEHEAIVDAIVRMDSPRAREAARHHMHESLTRHSTLGAKLGLQGSSG